MISKTNWSVLRNRSDAIGFGVDIVMLALVLVNLAFIIFDWHFGFLFVQNIIRQASPEFYVYYRDEVHPNFLRYDVFFVTAFVLELLIRWALAIKRKTHAKWYFYPLIHWYDVLGCIPLGTFRWLRLLRIFSMIIRLHRLGVIDLRETYAYKEAAKFYRIIVEEISDRVVIKILNGIQREIASDSPVTENLVTEVLKPHQHEIAQWMSHRIRTVTEHNYNIYRDDLKNYIEDAIGGAVKQNKEIQKIGSIPIVGRQISSGLEQGVSDITFEAINGLLTGLSSEKNTKVIEDFINAMFESILAQEKDQKLNRLIKDIFIGALDKIKEQVKRKKWQEDDKETAVAA